MLASAAHHYHQHQCRRRNLSSHCFALDAIRKLCSAAFIAPFNEKKCQSVNAPHLFLLLLCGIANCQWVNATAAAAAATHQTAIFVQLELLGGQEGKAAAACLLSSLSQEGAKLRKCSSSFSRFAGLCLLAKRRRRKPMCNIDTEAAAHWHTFSFFTECLIESLSFRWPVTQIGLVNWEKYPENCPLQQKLSRRAVQSVLKKIW